MANSNDKDSHLHWSMVIKFLLLYLFLLDFQVIEVMN